MLGFVRKSTAERLLREVLAERERLVQTLVEQLQHCRAQQGQATTTVSRAAQGEPPVPLEEFKPADDVEIKLGEITFDEEEQLLAMKQANVITDMEYEQALERIKSRNPDDIIE